jgi:hypothetical protein
VTRRKLDCLNPNLQKMEVHIRRKDARNRRRRSRPGRPRPRNRSRAPVLSTRRVPVQAGLHAHWNCRPSLATSTWPPSDITCVSVRKPPHASPPNTTTTTVAATAELPVRYANRDDQRGTLHKRLLCGWWHGPERRAYYALYGTVTAELADFPDIHLAAARFPSHIKLAEHQRARACDWRPTRAGWCDVGPTPATPAGYEATGVVAEFVGRMCDYLARHAPPGRLGASLAVETTLARACWVLNEWESAYRAGQLDLDYTSDNVTGVTRAGPRARGDRATRPGYPRPYQRSTHPTTRPRRRPATRTTTRAGWTGVRRALGRW